MRYWVLTGILVAAFLLQSVVANYLRFFGVSPDLLLVVVVSYGLLFGWEVGLVAAIIGGLLYDLTFGWYVGAHVLALSVVGVIAGLVEEKVFKDNILLAPSAGFVGTVVGQLIVWVIMWMFGRPVTLWESLRQPILPAALYNMILCTLVYGRIYKYYLYLKPDPRGTIVLRRT